MTSINPKPMSQSLKGTSGNWRRNAWDHLLDRELSPPSHPSSGSTQEGNKWDLSVDPHGLNMELDTEDVTSRRGEGALCTALDRELEELQRIIVSLEELEEEIDRDYGVEGCQHAGGGIPEDEMTRSEGSSELPLGEVAVGGCCQSRGDINPPLQYDYREKVTASMGYVDNTEYRVRPLPNPTKNSSNTIPTLSYAYSESSLDSPHTNGILSKLPIHDPHSSGFWDYNSENTNNGVILNKGGRSMVSGTAHKREVVSNHRDTTTTPSPVTNDQSLWEDLNPRPEGIALRDCRDITSSMEIQLDSDSDKVMPLDDQSSEGITSDRSDDLSDTDYTTDHCSDQEEEGDWLEEDSRVGNALTSSIEADQNNNGDMITTGGDQDERPASLCHYDLIYSLDPYLAETDQACLATNIRHNTSDTESAHPPNYVAYNNSCEASGSFTEVSGSGGGHCNGNYNGNVGSEQLRAALPETYNVGRKVRAWQHLQDIHETTTAKDEVNKEEEEGVPQAGGEGEGAGQEDDWLGPGEQLQEQLKEQSLQVGVTGTQSCVRNPERVVAGGGSRGTEETKGSTKTSEEGEGGSKPTDDPPGPGSPGHCVDKNLQEEPKEELQKEQQEGHIMGKSSRPPSPKKLVVDEVLPPGHPMPPPPRGSLRSAIPTPNPGSGGSSKSGLPIPRKTQTPVLEGRMSPRQSTPTPSAWCDHCLRLLVDLKRQALRMYKAYCSVGDRQGNTTNKDFDIIGRIEEKLHLSDGNSNRPGGAPWRETCEVCQTQLSRLKQEAINMVQSLDRTKADSPIPPPTSGSGIPSVPVAKNGVAIMPRTTPHYSSAHHRLVRQGVPGARGSSHGGSATASSPVDPKQYAWASAKHKHITAMLANNTQLMNGGRGPVTTNGDINGGVPYDPYIGGPHSPNMNGGPPPPTRPMALPLHHYGSSPDQRQPCLSPASTTSNGSGTSAAASFFARAAQKLNISSRKKRKHHGPDSHEQPYPTNFCEIIYNNPPPAPPVLLRNVGRPTNPGTGKVKVMLRICPVEGNQTGSFLSLDARRKQVTVYDPSINGYTTSAHRQRGVVAAPKMFAFDTIFSQDDSLFEMCANGLTDIIQAVVNGADGCLFCYGHARLGKTYTMIGVDDHPQNLGVIPCAVAWLFKLINEQKEQTGARFSVRVSAVEVTGKNEKLKDLLSDVAHGMDSGGGTAPGVYLREDPICGTQLENQSELRAPTADRAAHYLDAAVSARTVPEVEEDARNSHMLFTLHVYQYRVEKGGRGSNGVAGGRSRLHLVDLGSCSKSKDGCQALSLSALGNVILALLNGQRHVPHRESKLTQLMRDSLGNLSCRTCMIAHVSPAVHAYNETLQVIQLAARIHRMKRRRTNKFSSTSSESGSSCDESGQLRRRMRVGIRMGTLREDAMSMSDPDYTSSSEQSCDTVIYCGPNGQPLSDRELTDGEGPPRMVPVRPRMGRNSHLRISGSRSSGDESSSSHGDFRLGKPPMPKCGTNSRLPMKSGRSTPTMGGSPSRSLTGSPAPGVVQLPRKINLKGKQQTVNGHDPSIRAAWSKGPYREQPAKGNGPEQWVDGPSAPQYPPNGEQWIDGPDAQPMVYQPPPLQPMPSGEHWIDGPVLRPPGSQWVDQNAYHHQPPPQQAQYGAHSGNVNGNNEHWVDRPAPGPTKKVPQPAPANQARPANEQWVDGPMEFQMDVQTTASRAERPNKMWTEMAKPGSTVPQVKPAPPPRGMSLKQEEQAPAVEAPVVVAGIQPTMQAPPQPSDITKPVLPLRNPVLAHVAGQNQRPSSHVSTESCTSVAAQASDSDSRPVSMAGIEVSNMELATNCEVPSATQAQSLPGANVKSFVRDWVEKHSVMPATDPATTHHNGDQDNFIDSAQTILPLNEMLFGKNAVPLDTSSQPSSAHSSPHIKKRLRKGTLPPPIAHPMNRTAAWVVSVQNAGTETEDMMISPPEDLQDATKLAPECDQDLMRNSGPPPTYEDCMVDGEGEEVEVEVMDQECQVSIHTAENEEQEAAQGGTISQRPVEMVDSEVDTASVDNEGLDISNLLISNRTSIYELQMDETLECSRGADGSWPNTFTSEDDTSSSASLPRKNEDVCELYEVMDEVENVEIPSPSHYDEGVVGDLVVNMEKGAHGLSRFLPPDPQISPLSVTADDESGIASTNSGEHLSPPSSSSDSDKPVQGKKICRPTSLRRPDGASNPDLCHVEMVREIPEHEVISEKSLSSPEPLDKPVLPDSSPNSGSKSTMSEEAEEDLPPPSPVRQEGVGQRDSPDEEPGQEEQAPEQVSEPVQEEPVQEEPVQETPPSTPPAKSNSKLPFRSGIKPPVPVRSSSKLSILSKPSTKSSSSSSSAAAPPTSSSALKSPKAESPTSKGSKAEPTSKSTKAEPTTSKSSKAEPTTSKGSKAEPTTSKSSKAEPTSKSSKAEPTTSKGSKAESSSSKSSKSESSPSKSSSSPSRSLFRFGSKSKIAKAAAKAASPKAGSSPTKPTSPPTSLQTKASKEKSNKLSQKTNSPGSGTSNLSRPASVKSVPLTVQSATSRLTSSLSKLPTSSKNKDKTSPTKPSAKSKIPSPGKKDSKLPVSKVSNSRVSELNGGASGRGTDSDSGNDSGIVENENKKKLLSPYTTVTKPRNSTHSSSGHGSDNSSTFSGHLVPASPKIKCGEAHHSSGYESMLRDSEATASSSTQDSTSEGSCGGRTRGTKIFKKKVPVGTRRSRSAPPRTSEEPETPSTSTTAPPARQQSPATPVRAPLSPQPRAWVDTRQADQSSSEPLEITVYDVHDVERMQRRRKEDAEMRALEKRRARVRELVAKQEHLKQELAEAKSMLMIDRNTWSYDLYVAEQMDRDDPNYLEALEKETSILEKRVEACKSRIMMVTCFDMGV